MDYVAAGLAGVMVADVREGHGSSIRCAPAVVVNSGSHRVQQARFWHVWSFALR
jgi:hypothetical protein